MYIEKLCKLKNVATDTTSEPGERETGTKIFIRRGYAPRCKPLHFLNHFRQKRQPFGIPSIAKQYRFRIPT